jgi:hypothetical protein
MNKQLMAIIKEYKGDDNILCEKIDEWAKDDFARFHKLPASEQDGKIKGIAKKAFEDWEEKKNEARAKSKTL